MGSRPLGAREASAPTWRSRHDCAQLGCLALQRDGHQTVGATQTSGPGAQPVAPRVRRSKMGPRRAPPGAYRAPSGARRAQRLSPLTGLTEDTVQAPMS